MAPTAEILFAVVNKMEEIILHRTKEVEESTRLSGRPERAGVSEDTADHLDLMEFPSGGSNVEIILFFLLFPFRFLIHHTVPDVQALDAHGNPTATRFKAFLSVFSCLLWLIAGSYAMVASLEGLATLMDIPDAVIGVTVSAAGTSLPNYVASRAAAQNGFGVSFYLQLMTFQANDS
jgi:Ca2+/Na+ antiporter